MKEKELKTVGIVGHAHSHAVSAAVESVKDETPVVTTLQEDTGIMQTLAPFIIEAQPYLPLYDFAMGPKRKKGPHETTFWDSSSQGTYVNPKRQAKKAKKK